MQSSVSNRQMSLSMILICTAMASVTIARTMALSAGRGAWVTILLASLIFGLLAAVIVRLGRMFENKTLFEYSRDIGGPVLSYGLGIFYVLFFLLFDTVLCDSLAKMVSANFLLETPGWALILVLLPVLGFIAYKGINKAARLAEIYCIWFIVVAVTINVTMLIQGRWDYLLPLFNASDTGLYVSSVKETGSFFFGIALFLVVPMTAKNKKPAKTAFLTIAGIGLYYILVVYGCYAMIGLNEIKYHNYPLIDAVRLVEYPSIEFLQRVDVLYVTFGLIRTIIGKAFFYTVIVELLCKMLPKVKRLVLVIIVGAAFALVSIPLLAIDDIVEILEGALGFAGIAAVIVIPPVLLIMAKVKKKAW